LERYSFSFSLGLSQTHFKFQKQKVPITPVKFSTLQT
jgi:hypothetical protein